MNRLAQLFFSVLLFSGGNLFSQRVEAEALLSRDQIKIGEQVQLKLAVRYREGSKKSVVTWPELKDTIIGKVEIVKEDSILTHLANRASVLYEQVRNITITSFDSGMYVIPSQKFIVDEDTVQTDELQLYVSSIPVDTTKPIKDIKAIYDVPPPPVPFDSHEPTSWWIWATVAVVAIGVGLLVFYLTRKKKVEPEIIAAPGRKILLHEKYLEQLAELGRRKPWLQGELKQYHISLTEILRAWIVDRYRIHAKEMTTVEIIRTLNSMRANASAVMQLERALRMADMVKFAKWIPATDENENSLQLAINFIEATAEIPQPQMGPQR